MADRIKRRWLPSFSIRTLLIVTTLLCAYAACWKPTQTRGELDVLQSTDVAWGYIITQYDAFPTELYCATAAPLLVSVDEVPPGFASSRGVSRRYYFWFFGYVVKLPFVRPVQVADDGARQDIAEAEKIRKALEGHQRAAADLERVR